MNVGLSAIGNGYIDSVYNTQNQVFGGVGKGLTVSVTTIGGTINSVTVVNPDNRNAVGDLVNRLGPGPGIQALLYQYQVFFIILPQKTIYLLLNTIPYEVYRAYTKSSSLSAWRL